MSTLAELARNAGMQQVENASDPRLILTVDRVIAEYAASGMPFSANEIRDDLPVVAGPLIGAGACARPASSARSVIGSTGATSGG